MAVSDMYAIINGKTMNVYTQEQFFSNYEDLNSDDQVAVMVERSGERVVLPVRTDCKSMEKPGIYPVGNSYAFLSYPTTESEKKNYEPDDDHLVDFKNADNIQTLLSMTEKMKESINQYLEADTNGTIYKPILRDTDSAEMRGLKQCIIEKGVEIDKYGERFGPNWANDKRKLNDDNITMFLLKRMCNNFDLDVDIVFRDKSPDVPNPMGKTVTINLVPGNEGSPVVEEN